MRATEKLCQMLRERGIEHETAGGITTWPHSDGYTAEYDELLDESDTRLIVYKATPKQAIAATVWQGDVNRLMETLRDVDDWHQDHLVDVSLDLGNNRFRRAEVSLCGYDIDELETLIIEARLATEMLEAYTCKNMAPDYLDFMCDECCFEHHHSEENDGGDGNDWKYCPGCGRKIVR